MQVVCPLCNQNFAYLGSGKQPRVLPCGDSSCNECITQITRYSPSFMCRKCGINVESDSTFPLNKLYYEMQSRLKQYLSKKDYESPALSKGGQDELSRQHLKYDQKCLNPFCLRPRYQSQEVNELFCCRACRIMHEQLYMV